MIIGLSGRAGSGKDTVGLWYQEKHGFVCRAFADPLKEAAAAIFHLSEEQLYGKEKEVVDPFWGKSPRKILQLLGTDCVRRVIDDDVWIKSMERCIDGLTHDDGRHVVITDVRFPNEADAIRSWGGQVWRVVRPGVSDVEAHVSETALDNYRFDRVLINSGTLAEFRSLASDTLRSIL